MTNPAYPVRILIIDDDHDFADSQARYFGGKGYETAVAYTVAEATTYLNSHGLDVHLALVDMYMGRDKKAGLKLISLISERYWWIVSIVVTAHGEFDNAIECMQAGAFSYIMKGTSPQVLITETVKKAHERFRLGMIKPAMSEITKAVSEIIERIHRIEEVLLRIRDEGVIESHARSAGRGQPNGK